MKVLSYLCTCSKTFIKIKRIIYKGICLHRVSIGRIPGCLHYDCFDNVILYFNELLMSVVGCFKYAYAAE